MNGRRWQTARCVAARFRPVGHATKEYTDSGDVNDTRYISTDTFADNFKYCRNPNTVQKARATAPACKRSDYGRPR